MVCGVSADEDVVEVVEDVAVGEGFDFEDVEGCAANPIFLQGDDQGFFVDGIAAAKVDDDAVAFHGAEFGVADDAFGVGGVGHGEEEIVAGGHEVELAVHAPDLVGEFVVGGFFWTAAEGHDFHAEGFGAFSGGLADVAIAEDAEGFAFEHVDIEDIPFAGGLTAAHAAEVFGKKEHGGDTVFAEGIAIGSFGIGYGNV